MKRSWNAAQATSTKRDNTHWWSSSYLGLDNTDAEAQPQAETVTNFPLRPRGYVEFDITRAVRQWRSGVPNYGVLIRATNELEIGRGIRCQQQHVRYQHASLRPRTVRIASIISLLFAGEPLLVFFH